MQSGGISVDSKSGQVRSFINQTQSDYAFECKGLNFCYWQKGLKVPALFDFDLKIKNGDFVTICGPSGSGKSSLLNLLGMIEPIQEGDILLDGQSYRNLSEKEKNHIRRFRLGFIFQTFNLIDVLTAEENVEFFLNSQALSESEKQDRLEHSLKAVGLWEHRFKKPHQMSGGQRQRVGIARALAKRPQVILADEPTASLDQKNGREIVEILKQLNQNEKVTIVISSHDPMVIEQSLRTVELRDGRIQSDH